MDDDDDDDGFEGMMDDRMGSVRVEGGGGAREGDKVA